MKAAVTGKSLRGAAVRARLRFLRAQGWQTNLGAKTYHSPYARFFELPKANLSPRGPIRRRLFDAQRLKKNRAHYQQHAKAGYQEIPWARGQDSARSMQRKIRIK
jgi:hypothetical protein